MGKPQNKQKRKKAGDSDDEGAAVKSAKKGKQQQKSKARLVLEEDEDAVRGSLSAKVDMDQLKREATEAEERADAADEAAGSDEEKVNLDPYLMADASYIKKDTRWRNKQRTLIFNSRGVVSGHRLLAEDLKKLLPHHKAEPKFEKKSSLHDINEVCELKSCNNAIFFEARKKTDLYMWVARLPSGPSLKFQVTNIHTTAEVRFAGNCLLGSRPVLYFDKNFENLSYLRLVKTLFTQVYGTPRNHPKSKPFHDHVMGFYYLDKKIWFRHYMISPETTLDGNDPEKQECTEIGPRFVMDPIVFLNGSFGGKAIYSNPFYMSPTALRVQAKKFQAGPYRHRQEAMADRRQRLKDAEFDPDELDEAFE